MTTSRPDRTPRGRNPIEDGAAWRGSSFPLSGGRRLLPRLALGAALLLAIETAVLAGGSGQAVALSGPASREAAPTQSDDAKVTEAADIPSAKVAAKLAGHRVEALSERTETSTTWVNADGSLTTDLFAGPVRLEDEEGQWREVDVSLTERKDGNLTARAHPAGLMLAGEAGTPAGSLEEAEQAPARDLLRLGSGDERLTLRWKGGLPEPVIEGEDDTIARYPEALPGADLLVEATRTGFEQYVQLTERPEVKEYSYTLPLKSAGLNIEPQSDGSILFTDPETGEERAVMPAPVMWDATVDPVSGDHAKVVAVDMEVRGEGEEVELVLTPDIDFLTDPDTLYPVTIDPSTGNLGNVFDTLVKQGDTTDWSTNTELHIGNPGTTNPDGTERWSRSFITWDTSPIRDALVSSAQLRLYNTHSGNTDCAPAQWTVWETGAASTATRWTNQPQWIQQYASSTQTAGRANCGGPAWITANVTDLVQVWASAKATRGHMGLRAPSSATSQWKQVRSANAASNPPRLTVTYNYRPRTGTQQEAGPPYFSYSGEYVVNTTTPTLRDTFIDADGDKVNGTFDIRDAVTDAQIGTYLVSPRVNSGTPAEVKVPANLLTHGKRYKFRTSPYDGTHYNLGWSAWKFFTVDTQAPNAPPTITSTDYPTGQWVKGKGQSGVFRVTPPTGTDHHWLEWSLDGVSWTKHQTNGTSGAKNITITPDRDGTHTLQVRAVDKADNTSDATEYTFHAGPGGFTQPAEGERTARRIALIADADAAAYNNVTFSWRRSEADPWQPIPPAHITTGDNPLQAWPVPMAGGRNARLIWDATTTVDPDGAIQIKADFTGPNNATGHTEPLTVVVDRNASGAAVESVGPGSVNLLTGDYTISEEDLSHWDLTVTRTASSRTPDKGGKQEGQVAIFGPEWVAGTVAELSDSDYSHVRVSSTTAVSVVTTEGDEIHFTANAAKSNWIPEPGSEELVLTGSTSGSFTLTDEEGTVTEFTKPDPTSETWVVSSSLINGLANSTTTIVSETVTVAGTKLARPKRVIAPTSAVNAATCTSTPSTKGCRALEFVYANSTTATADALGDYTGRVKEIRLWSTEPGAATATARTVQTYRYDNEGRLCETWDPLITPALKTAYAYDEAGRVTRVTSPGELPWTLTYGRVGNTATAGEGMLLKATRPALKQGTADEVQGEAVTSVVYDVPLTGSKAPYAMGTTHVAAWGQTDAPTDATAIFPADTLPTSHTGENLTAADYRRATLTYLGVSARQVNKVEPGGHVTTAETDRFGNAVRELTAANRALALGGTAAERAQLAHLGIAALPTAERAELLSTRSVFNENGVRKLEEFGPLRRVDLSEDLKDGSTVLVPARTSVVARKWTINTFDQGRPTNGTATVRDQITRSDVGARVREHPTAFGEVKSKSTVYDWVRGLPVETVEDPDGLRLATRKEYDDQGREVKVTVPGGSDTSVTTHTTRYWTATGTGACAGRPEWADQVCATGPAGQATGGGSNPVEMPTQTKEYDWWGNTAKVTETANGVTRTTVTTHDGAGRKTRETITGPGTAIPEVTTEYDPANGKETRHVSTAGGTITKAYDKLGREISYTDANAGTTRTHYDLLDRPVRITDSVPSTVTHTYDHTIDPRGLATGTTDSVAGTFRATYDADGKPRTEKLPGGYTLTEHSDPEGSVTERVYTRDSDGAVVYTDTVTVTVHGQVAEHAGWSSQRYRYDRVGRLTEVEDTARTICTRRTYTFDQRTNRTALRTATGNPGEDCPNSGGTTTTYGYDSADRITGSGYTYDGFGRTTAVPGSSVAYYTNDFARRITSGSERQTWTLDSALRYRTWTVESNSSGTWTQTVSKRNHYAGDGDNPRWIVENTATGEVTRNVESASGDLAATTGTTGDVVLQVATIHGDVAVQLPLAAGAAPVVLDFDEYGNPRTEQPAVRYGWLGAKRRSAEAGGGLMLMGARVYDPRTGRFLSIDPVRGGSHNAYEFGVADPINRPDVNGEWVPLVVFGVRAAVACFRYCKKAYKAAKYAYRGYKWGRSMRRGRHAAPRTKFTTRYFSRTTRSRASAGLRHTGCLVGGYLLGSGSMHWSNRNAQVGAGLVAGGLSLGASARGKRCWRMSRS
ncbi:DNRLRE domain-containing protein [Streptomyces sp. ST2-7A]|uniref:DNRLRE domain-containing protein n=1 Tax=Streptomyces sp. ST2-7A TaxID=2907214 RepID=UPI001F163E51|nr:DNRLRE domain-containing protein [Streptomyces sp. ST2-7A]MCE7080311.1 DNRLRE domain-containing protein [Streptomyces sp. ST2-7A]